MARSRGDFERLASEIDPVIASKGKLAASWSARSRSRAGEKLNAIASHLKFIADHHPQIERVRRVRHRLLEIMPRVAELFVHPKVRHFGFEEKDRALAWLETGR